MSLKGYQPETRVIPLGHEGESFAVRGLSLNHLAVLVREHFPDLDAIVMLFQGIETLANEQFQSLALSVISQAPGFAANVIALAAGEGSAEDAEKLPLGVQIRALIDIGEMTFAEVGGVGKAWGIVADLLKKTSLIEKRATFQKPARAKNGSSVSTLESAAT